MKALNITIAFLGVLLIAACGDTGKKRKNQPRGVPGQI